MIIQKDGHLFCPEYLSFVRRQPCFHCGARPPVDPDHYPSRGKGVTRDDLTGPACRECHQRLDGQTVNGKPPIPREQRKAAVDATRSLFLSYCTDEEMKSFVEARKKWRQRRMEAW